MHICVLAITYTCEYSVTTLSSVEVVQLNPLVLHHALELCSFRLIVLSRYLVSFLPSSGRCFRPRRAVVFASFCFVSVGEELFGETLVWALWTFVGVLDSVFAFVRPSSWGPGPYFSHPPTLRNRTTQPPASAQGVALEPSEAGRFQR